MTLASSDSFPFSWQSRVATANHRYFVAPTYAEGRIAVFDATGKLTGSLSRPGSGPGELSHGNVWMTVGPADSLHVINNNRWLVFAPPNYKFVRSTNLRVVPTASVIVDTGANTGDLLVAYPSRVANGRLFTVHLIGAQSGEVIRSFDAPDTGALRDKVASLRSIDWADDRIWSVQRNRISIRSETLNGDSVTTWLRADGWFPGWSESNDLEPYFATPRPIAGYIRAVGGAIWLFAVTADDDWRPLERPAGAEVPARLVSDIDLNSIFDGMLKVVDRATGTALARVRSDWVMQPVEGSSALVQRTRETALGDIAIDLFRVTLRR